MKSILLIALAILLSFNNVQAQLPNGSIAPDFTLVDLNGTTHTLYDYLDAGQTVFLDFSAIWCPPCWGYHQSHELKDVYENHGPTGLPGVLPSTTNDVMVFFIEGQAGTLAELNGGGSSMGDWVTGTPYPIICTDPSVSGNTDAVSNDYQIPYWPTVYQVCPDRTITLIGAVGGLYSLATSCLPPPSQNNDARSFMNSSPSTGCSSIVPEITIQNYGLNSLTEVVIEVSLNGSLQYTTTFNETWSNSTNSYVPLNLSTLDIADAVLDPVTGLVNGDEITINVSLPNGVSDTDPSNNQTITFVVDLGYANAYWDGDLDISVAGGTTNSWYLKQVSNGLIIASGYGGVSNVTNNFPLVFNECYTLQSIQGGGLQYTVIDAMGNTILDGQATGVEDFDNFSTGAEVWTGIENTILDFNIYPNPVVNNLLVIDGDYTSVTIYDIFGKAVFTSNYQQAINVADLSNGIYFVHIKTDATIAVEKITIAK